MSFDRHQRPTPHVRYCKQGLYIVPVVVLVASFHRRRATCGHSILYAPIAAHRRQERPHFPAIPIGSEFAGKPAAFRPNPGSSQRANRRPPAPEMKGRFSLPRLPLINVYGRDCVTQHLPLAAQRCVGHIRLTGDVAEWLKAAVC